MPERILSPASWWCMRSLPCNLILATSLLWGGTALAHPPPPAHQTREGGTVIQNSTRLVLDCQENITCTNTTGVIEIDGVATAWSAIGDPTGAGAVAMAETAQTLDWNTAATAAAFDGLSISITNDATTDTNTQRVVVIENLSDAGTLTVERLLVLDNADGDAVTTALEIVGTSTGAITTAIDVSDAEIGTALSIGANIVNIADAGFVDLGAILHNDATEQGFQLPNVGASPTDVTGTGEGYLAWNETDNRLLANNGTAWQTMNGWVLQHSSGTGQTVTFWAMPGGETSGSETTEDEWRMPLASTCSNLYVGLQAAPGAGNSWAVSLNINGTASTNVTCTISGTATTCSDLTGSESIAADATVNIEFLESGTAVSTSNLAVSAFCQLN